MQRDLKTMNNQKMWHEVFKPVLLQYLKDKKVELEKEGYIPTLEILIEELENEI